MVAPETGFALGLDIHGTLLEPGRVRHAGEGPTYIGTSKETEGMLKEISRIFNSSGIPITLSNDLNTLILLLLW